MQNSHSLFQQVWPECVWTRACDLILTYHHITCAPNRNTDSGAGSGSESWIPVNLIRNPLQSFQAGSSSTPILQIRKLNTKWLTCPRWFKCYVADPQFEGSGLAGDHDPNCLGVIIVPHPPVHLKHCWENEQRRMKNTERGAWHRAVNHAVTVGWCCYLRPLQVRGQLTTQLLWAPSQRRVWSSLSPGN